MWLMISDSRIITADCFLLLSQSLFENPGLEFRLQAAERLNRLKAGLQTQSSALQMLF
jgi:hypothetical protein